MATLDIKPKTKEKRIKLKDTHFDTNIRPAFYLDERGILSLSINSTTNEIQSLGYIEHNEFLSCIETNKKHSITIDRVPNHTIFYKKLSDNKYIYVIETPPTFKQITFNGDNYAGTHKIAVPYIQFYVCVEIVKDTPVLLYPSFITCTKEPIKSTESIPYYFYLYNVSDLDICWGNTPLPKIKNESAADFVTRVYNMFFDSNFNDDYTSMAARNAGADIDNGLYEDYFNDLAELKNIEYIPCGLSFEEIINDLISKISK